MHIVDYTDRDGHVAQAALGDTVWEALVEVAESCSQSLAEICVHVDATRRDNSFTDSLETFLYHYYKTKTPSAFGGMKDGDSTDNRFEHGLRGLDKDGLFD